MHGVLSALQSPGQLSPNCFPSGSGGGRLESYLELAEGLGIPL